MGQKTNPIILKIEKNQIWKSKYFEKKSSETMRYTYKDIEIQSYMQQFFKNYGLILHNCKIHYKSVSLDIFVSYYLALKLLTFQQDKNQQDSKFESATDSSILFFKMRKYDEYKSFSNKKIFKISSISEKKFSHQIIGRNNNIVELNFKEHKLGSQNLIKPVVFLKKLTESLSLFTGKKLNISLILSQLNKSVLYNKKSIELNKRQMLNLRRYHKEEFYHDAINIFTICTFQKDCSQLLAEFIALQLKRQNKRHNLFLQFLKDLMINFQRKKPSILKGIQIKISGRFNKLPRAKSLLLKIGQLKIISFSSKISYHEATSYSQNGTFGVKTWIIEKSK
jgi:ribosomal protein S3